MFADRATLIGDTTAGAGGQVIEVSFGSGAKLAVTAREPSWESHWGAGCGFPPRVYSISSAKGLASNTDDVLEHALVFIRERAN